jgi:hypothetical protein
LLSGLRERLARSRLTHPLFDTDRSRRHIEAACVTMLERWRQGESPRSFSVAPDGGMGKGAQIYQATATGRNE